MKKLDISFAIVSTSLLNQLMRGKIEKSIKMIGCYAFQHHLVGESDIITFTKVRKRYESKRQQYIHTFKVVFIAPM